MNMTLRIIVFGQRLRDIALKEEIKLNDAGSGTTPTLMGLAGSLSRFYFVSKIWSI